MLDQSTRRMRVIPKPPPQPPPTMIAPTFKGPVMKGHGLLSYTCGNCSNTLLRHVHYKEVQDVVIKCFSCGSYNEIPAAHHTN